MVRSLRDHCISYLNNHLDLIHDIGDMDYKTVRPFLINLKNPNQLHELEQNCSQLIGYTGEVWRRMINAEFSQSIIRSREPLHPKNPEDWYVVYEELQEAKQREEEQAEAFLRSKMAEFNTARDENKLAAPTMLLKPKTSRTTHWSMGSSSYERKPSNLMGRIKQSTAKVAAQRRQAALTATKAGGKSITPVRAQIRSTVVRAPQHMLDEARKVQQEETRRIVPPSRGKAHERRLEREAQAQGHDTDRLAAEERLRRLTSGASTSSQARPAAPNTVPPAESAPTREAVAQRSSLVSANTLAKQKQLIRKVLVPTTRKKTPEPEAPPRPERTPEARRPLEEAPGRPTEGTAPTPNRKRPAAEAGILRSNVNPLRKGRR